MVALRCASLALLVAFAVASDCDKDELDLCDYMSTECDADELDLCDGEMGGGGSATDCDADELDLCDDTSGGGGSIDDSATPTDCDADELDLCDDTSGGGGSIVEATPAPTEPAATPEPTEPPTEPAATPAPTADACTVATMQWGTACATANAIDKEDRTALVAAFCGEGACKTSTTDVITACAGNSEQLENFKPIQDLCSPCMQKMMAATAVCMKKDSDGMAAEAELLCSDACSAVIGEMKTLECDKMSEGRRLSAEELKISKMVRSMVNSVPSARRLGGHEKDENPAGEMVKAQEFMCSSACGKAAMPWMVACGFDDKKDDHGDDHGHDRRLGESKMMCWDVCQDASQKVKDACKADRRLGSHEEDDEDDKDDKDMEMNPAAMHEKAEETMQMCTPCGVAMASIGHFEEKNQIACETDTGLNDQCKDVLCAVKNGCPAAAGLTEAPAVVRAAKMDFDQYKGFMTQVAALGCDAAPTPAPTTADTILTIQYALAGDYATVVADKKEQFLTECTAKLQDTSTVCSDVRAGSIIVDITGKLSAATAAVQSIESSADKSLTLASFGPLKAQGKVATVVAAAEAVTKLSDAFPTPAPTPPPTPAPEVEDADGAVSMYGTLAGTSMAIAAANIL